MGHLAKPALAIALQIEKIWVGRRAYALWHFLQKNIATAFQQTTDELPTKSC